MNRGMSDNVYINPHMGEWNVNWVRGCGCCWHSSDSRALEHPVGLLSNSHPLMVIVQLGSSKQTLTNSRLIAQPLMLTLVCIVSMLSVWPNFLTKPTPICHHNSRSPTPPRKGCVSRRTIGSGLHNIHIYIKDPQNVNYFEKNCQSAKQRLKH